MLSPKIAHVSSYCVACVMCMKECPREAITIEDGIKAHIHTERCVGCGTCVRVCPASAIELQPREATQHAH